MLRNDPLKRFERRGVRAIITVAIVLGICTLAGIIAIAIFPPPRSQQNARPAESKPEIALTVPNRTLSFAPKNDASALAPAPVIQSAPIIPAVRFRRIPDQTEMDDKWFPDTNRLNPTSFPNVPIPVARPNRQVIASIRKSAKTEESNNKNKNNIAIRDGPVNQVEAARRQSNTIVHESKKSGFDTRKTAAIELEQSYVNGGVAVSTHVSGIDGTVLNIEYPQFNDTLVRKIMSVQSFAVTLAKVGFTKIIFTADQNKMWVFPLQPPPQSETALQERASTNK